MTVLNRSILIPIFFMCSMLGTGAIASPQDDRVAQYLRQHDMLSLLEVQLEQRIEEADDVQERDQLAEELSELYLRQLRETDNDDPYRQIVLLRAAGLVTRMAQVPMYELRLELLIDEYVKFEPDVELARLDLLDGAKRDKAIAALNGLARKLEAIIAKIEPALAQVERRSNRATGTERSEVNAQLESLRRFRSLANYYNGWVGYSLASLRDQHVPPGVFVSFGWLLDGNGSTPQMDVLDDSTLEYEHVARAALGVAMAYAQSDQLMLARAWAKMVAESEYVSDAVREAGEDRLLQIYAMDRDWTEANRYARFIVKRRGNGAHLRVGDARFLAMRALGALQLGDIGKGGAIEAQGTAQYAIEQLIDLGEIGQVVDLYLRFDSLPQMNDGFIPRYAHALAELNRIEQAREDGRYNSIADLFARALKSEDAGDYPDHQEDCRLKLAYALILANHPKDAIASCEQVIKGSLREKAIEEARWMRIAALDQLNRNTGRDGSPELAQAVREYIEGYPATARSAKLILRYAMQGTVDPRVAINTLESIGDDDPIAIPARRALVQLRYKSLRDAGFTDQDQLSESLKLVEWLIAAEPETPADLNEARARLGTIRIGLDMAIQAKPPRDELAQDLLERGMRLVGYDSTLAIYHAELIYRQIELTLHADRLDDAIDLMQGLDTLDPKLASNARVLVLNRLIQQWQQEKNTAIARRICDIGSGVLASMTPAFPSPIGVQVSTIAELVADAAAWRWTHDKNTEMRDLALRVSKMVLERGQPSESGLRRTAQLATSAEDANTELDAWLTLLAAYPGTDERWYEARYESLRILKQLSPDRADETFAQYRVLHPDLGPEPWASRFAELFDLPRAVDAPERDGGAP